MAHVFHLSRIWGSRHGGSAYSQAMVEELRNRGWAITLVAEEFLAGSAGLERVRLAGFFRRGLSASPRRMRDQWDLWRRVVTTPDALVVVQGDLPRVVYILLQFLVPLVFVRQDGILTCPGNNRFLARSRTVCRRPMGLWCLKVHQREGCLSGLPWWKQLGRVAFRTRDRLLLRCIRVLVTNSQYLAGIHGRAAQVLYPPLLSHACTAGSHAVNSPPREAQNANAGTAQERDGVPRKTAGPTRVLNARDLRRLVFCGRLEPVKGAAEAISILALLPEQYSLQILGEGVEQGRLGHLVEALALRSRVKFLGWVDGPSRDRTLATAGALLMPSLWDEAFGMAGPEALAQGTPVVAYDVGGIAEWCRDGAGVLVPCGDMARAARAVQELTADPVRWATHSLAARRIVELEFPAQRFARELDRILEGASLRGRDARRNCVVTTKLSIS